MPPERRDTAPQDLVRFDVSGDPDWDAFMQTEFQLALLPGDAAPLVKSNPGINNGDPYVVIAQSDGLSLANPKNAEFQEERRTGAQILAMTPKGTAILLDEGTAPQTIDVAQVDFLRSEVQRLGLDKVTLKRLMRNL